MAKRTTTAAGAVKRTKKTASRTRTVRRTARKAVEDVAPEKAPDAVGPAGGGALHEPTTEQIAERAYFLSLERSGPGGPLDDWLQAEHELRNGSIPL